MKKFADMDPGEKMDYAAGWFDLASVGYSPQLAEQAAGLFQLGAGELLLEHLMQQGFSDDEVDAMLDDGTLIDHVGDAQEEVNARLARLDGRARSVLGALAWDDEWL